MSTTFADHFSDSKQAQAYGRFRPRYPRELYEFLAREAPSRERAWDCATGSGQAAVSLAEFFGEVLATDPSSGQLSQAHPHERVRYSVATAELSGLPSQSVDLVTVAQAVHWFDLERFYAEVRRVAKPRAVLAFWAYGPHLSGVKEIDDLFKEFGYKIIGPYWPAETANIQRGYSKLEFPFAELETPTLELKVQWSLNELEGYLASWSATQRYKEANGGEDPFLKVKSRLLEVWGGPAEHKRVLSCPLDVRAGRVK